AVDASLSAPSNIALDGRGNVYIADIGNYRVRRVNPKGVIDTVAGNGQPGFSGDGGPATAASLSAAFRIALDPAGSLYIADSVNHRIRKVTPDGIIRTIAGTGQAGFFGD